MIGIATMLVLSISFAVGTFATIVWATLRKKIKKPKVARNISLGIFLIFTTTLCTWGLSSLVYIGPDQVGVLEVRFWPGWKRLPPGQFVARDQEIGIQAALLEPGVHFRPAFLTNVTLHPLVEIQQERIGIVETLDGQPLQEGMETSPHAWQEEGWFEPLAYLTSNHNYRGIQRPPLRPGLYRLHPHLFRIIPVDTTTRVLRFGEGEADFQKQPGPGRYEEIQASAQGTSVLVHVRIHYRVTPDSAYKLIARHGTTHHDQRVLELVQSTTRTVVEAEIEKRQLRELKDERNQVQNAILERIQEIVALSGVVVDYFAFTSIYPPNGPDGDSFRAFDKERASQELFMAQKATEQGKVELNQARLITSNSERELALAEAAIEQEPRLALAKSEAKASQIRSEAEAVVLLSQLEISNRELAALAAALGPEGTAFLLAVRESAKHGIDLLPDTVVPNTGDQLLGYFLERFANTIPQTTQKRMPLPVDTTTLPSAP